MIDYQSVRCARVYLRGTLAGSLEKYSTQSHTSGGGYSFQYNAEYLKSPGRIPIACAFRLRSEPYLSPQLHPFFDNLILEGWLLSFAETIFKIDRKNRFALLMAIGRSSIGAVSIHPLDPDGNEYLEADQLEPDNVFPSRLEEVVLPHKNGCCPSCLKPSPKGQGGASGRIMHQRCAYDLFGTTRKLKIELDAERPLETFSRTIYGGSISGAQRKGLFYLDHKLGVIRPHSIQSQYILKPDGDHPELPANEHLSMAIAREIGFRVPAFCLIRTKSLGFIYVIRRFDRVNGTALRMEDMAQVIGASSEDKYDSSNEKVVKAIKEHVFAPKLDLNDYFRRILFCFLISNGDMHLKNWSILEKSALNGEMDLSPCYDLLNTRLPIPRESIDIGLSICGKKKNFQHSYFQRLAEESLGTEKKFIEKCFLEIKEWLETIKIFAARSYLTKESRQKYIDLSEQRALILRQ